MNIAIYGRPFSKNLFPFIEELLQSLTKLKANCSIFEPFYKAIKTKLNTKTLFPVFAESHDIKEFDFLFSVGGDGTLLDTITLVRDSKIPILGINIGRLGFLASISKNNINDAMDSLAKGHYSIDSRSLLRLETNNNLFGEVNYALNELTIHKKETSSMITIHAYLNGEYLNSYWADGLIIATPTGSTGYSLSCGGPIILPQSENLVITPIAPHNLNVRPVIVSDKNIISLEVEGRGQRFLATLDSRSTTIDASVQLAIKKENFKINLVRLNNENFLDTLRNKLMWGMDIRN